MTTRWPSGTAPSWMGVKSRFWVSVCMGLLCRVGLSTSEEGRAGARPSNGAARLLDVVLEHDAVAGFAGAEVLEGVVDLGHREFLGDGRDVVAGGELEHAVDDAGA